jgi:hypothetical protein
MRSYDRSCPEAHAQSAASRFEAGRALEPKNSLDMAIEVISLY